MTRRRDRAGARRAALAATLAVAQPLSARLARWTGTGTPEVAAAAATEGPVTPAGGAFVIWAPLFAGSLWYAATDLRSGTSRTPAAGWANAAMAGNVAWSLNAQFRRLDEVSVALIVGSAAAAIRATALAERDHEGAAGADVRRPFAALAGWLSVAAFANVETTLNLRRGRPDDRSSSRRAVVLIGAASGAACAVSAAVRGDPWFAATAGWGLGGIALKAWRHRQGPVVATACAGLAGLGLTVRRSTVRRARRAAAAR